MVYENMTSYQKDFLGKENTAVYEAYVEKFQELAVAPIQDFMQELSNLPELDEITADHTGTIYAVMSKYENFSSYQKGLINEETMEIYNAYADKYKELTADKTEETPVE